MSDLETNQWKSQTLSHLIQWRRRYDLLNQETNKLHEVLLLPPESPFIDAAWKVFDSYTEYLSDYLGDKEDWLSWYCWDNTMGDSQLEVEIDGTERVVESLEDLTDLMWSVAPK